MLEYLEFGIVRDEAERDRLERAGQFLRYRDRELRIFRDGKWLLVPSPNQRVELAQERHVLLRHAGAHAIT